MQNESQLYSSISEQYIVPRLRDSVTTAEVCGLYNSATFPNMVFIMLSDTVEVTSRTICVSVAVIKWCC